VRLPGEVAARRGEGRQLGLPDVLQVLLLVGSRWSGGPNVIPVDSAKVRDAVAVFDVICESITRLQADAATFLDVIVVL
jgi:hypothetical protein